MSTVEQDIERAEATYAEHVIKSRGEGRWLLQRPGCGNFWTEIIYGEAGTIIVHGDGPDIVFRSWPWKADAEYLVRWLAGSNLDYIAGKVCCGERQSWDRDLAVEQLRDDIEQSYDAESPAPEGLVELLESASDYGFPETAEQMSLAMAEADDDWEYWTPGERPSWDIIAARAACRRLVELLDAEAKPDGEGEAA